MQNQENEQATIEYHVIVWVFSVLTSGEPDSECFSDILNPMACKNPETGNQTFRTLYQYILEKPEYSYLAVQQIIKRLTESTDNLKQFCQALNLKAENGFISIVPIPECLLKTGPLLRRTLLDMKNTHVKWFTRNQYKCWVITREESTLTTRFLRQEEISQSANLLNSTQSLIGIYAFFGNQGDETSSETASETDEKFRSKSSCKVSRGRLVSLKKVLPKSNKEQKTRSLSVSVPKSPSHPKKTLSKQSQKSSQSYYSMLRAKTKSNSSLLGNTNQLSQTYFSDLESKVSSKHDIPRRKKFSVSYKGRPRPG